MVIRGDIVIAVILDLGSGYTGWTGRASFYSLLVMSWTEDSATYQAEELDNGSTFDEWSS